MSFLAQSGLDGSWGKGLLYRVKFSADRIMKVTEYGRILSLYVFEYLLF